MMGKLTKAQIVTLTITRDLGGPIKVFPDQFGIVTGLEARGLMQGNGKIIGRMSSITEAGRVALSSARRKP